MGKAREMTIHGTGVNYAVLGTPTKFCARIVNPVKGSEYSQDIVGYPELYQIAKDAFKRKISPEVFNDCVRKLMAQFPKEEE